MAISEHAADGVAMPLVGAPAVLGTILGLTLLGVAAWRAGAARPWVPAAIFVGWMLPLASGTGLVPAAAGAALLVVALGSVGVRVARMSDAAWAERPSRAQRATTLAKPPKIAAESAG